MRTAAKIRCAALCLTLLSSGAANADFPSAKPYMGWNSWFGYGTSNTQSSIEAISDFMSTGAGSALKAAGYNIIWVDDGWAVSRGGGGAPTLSSNFTDMKALADHVKANGMIPMIYTDGGSSGCSVGFGSAGHIQDDVTLFLSTWGYQGIKVDSCGMEADGLDPKTVYQNFVTAVQNTGVSCLLDWCPASYSLLSPSGTNPIWAFGAAHGNAWRTSSDIGGPVCSATYTSVLTETWRAAQHREAQGPYHFNDPDYLMVGAGMSPAEETSQFALWSILSAPLIIGCDPRGFSGAQLTLLTNSEMIAINQDGWSLTPYHPPYSYANSTEVFIKWLSVAGTRAILLSNEDSSAHDITVNFSDAGITGTVQLRDLVSGTNLGSFTTSYTATAVPAHSVKFVKLTGGTEVYTTCFATAAAGANQSGTNCTWQADANGNGGIGGLRDGTTATTAHAIDRTGVTNPAPEAIYQQARVGTAAADGASAEGPVGYFAWGLDPAYNYTVRLHFSENSKTAANQRKFDVALNNGSSYTQVLTDFDVFATAGAQYKATVQEFTLGAPHGAIGIILSSGSVDYPMLAGVEVVQGALVNVAVGSGRMLIR